MSIKVDIFYPRFKELICNPNTLELDGSNVGQCLNNLVKLFLVVGKLLFDKLSSLHRQVYVYLNAESTYKAALDALIKDGDRLIIATP